MTKLRCKRVMTSESESHSYNLSGRNRSPKDRSPDDFGQPLVLCRAHNYLVERKASMAARSEVRLPIDIYAVHQTQLLRPPAGEGEN